MKELKATKPFEIRFSEVDSMGVVWHGAYTDKEYNLMWTNPQFYEQWKQKWQE